METENIIVVTRDRNDQTALTKLDIENCCIKDTYTWPSRCVGKDVYLPSYLPMSEGDKFISKVARAMKANNATGKLYRMKRLAWGETPFSCIHEYVEFLRRDNARSDNEIRSYLQAKLNDVDAVEIPFDKPEQEKKKPQADALVELALENTSLLFTDQYKEPHAVINCGGHNEIWPVNSTAFRRWMGGLYFANNRRACNSDAIKAAVNTVEAQAFYNGDGEKELHNRVAWFEDALWYDLSNSDWEAVEITSEGWKIVKQPPIIFRRFKNQTAQVTPARGGILTPFYDLTNIKDDESKLLALVWMMVAFIPGFPHAVVNLYGPQGSAKSSFFRTVRQIIDPGVKLTDSLPRSQEDLTKKIHNQWFTPLDNLTSLPSWASDTICRAITGEGHSERTLYTNNDEVLLTFKRVVAINGINLVASRPDLLDRSIIIDLERIPPDRRKREQELSHDLDKAMPGILGAIFDTLSKALAVYPEVEKTLTEFPRMADFTLWGYAVAEAMGGDGEAFLRSYENNRKKQNLEAIEGHPVARAIVCFMENKKNWEGSPDELLTLLDNIVEGFHKTTSRHWPQAGYVLTRRLNIVKVNLADVGIDVETGIHTEKGNILRIAKNSFSPFSFVENEDSSGFTAEGIPEATEGIANIASGGKPRPVEVPEATEATEGKIHVLSGKGETQKKGGRESVRF